MSLQDRNITIIGAGLVGSLLSILLKKRGFNVTILEKRSDSRKNPLAYGRSINLIVTSRGLFALSLAGLEEKAKALSVQVYGREIHDLQSKTFYQPYGQKKECNYAISRSGLNNFLMTEAEALGVQIHFEQKINEIDFEKKTLTKQDGLTETVLRYGVLFGTDGVGSIVRQQLIKKMPHQFQEKKEWLGVSYKELVIPADAQGKPLIKPDALHIWPRGQFMMMALANLDQSFTVTLYMPEKANTGPSFDQLVTDEQIADFFQQQFPDSVGLMNAANPARGDAKPSVLVNDFKSNPSMPLGNLRLNQWVYKDSVAILGDASHGIVPFFGQGMNSGFEDCSDLISLMDKTSDWHSLLDQLQTLRKPNADAIADMAVENWFEMSERVADPKFILRKKVEVILEEKIPQDFKSRYGMVTYTQIPYAQVQYLGNLQNQIFQKLLTHVDQIEDVDFEKAKLLIHDHYTPEYRKSLSAK